MHEIPSLRLDEKFASLGRKKFNREIFEGIENICASVLNIFYIFNILFHILKLYSTYSNKI